MADFCFCAKSSRKSRRTSSCTSVSPIASEVAATRKRSGIDASSLGPGHSHERSSVTVTISMTGRSCAVALRARKIICPAVSRNISTSEYLPGDGTKAWRTFARMSAFKCTASVRFKAVSPRKSKVTEADPALDPCPPASPAERGTRTQAFGSLVSVLRSICAPK